jgi:lipoate-protein ligase A
MENLKNYDFEMFTEDGNKACRKMVAKIFNKIEGKTRITLDDVYKHILEGVKSVEGEHPEIHDTEPENNIEYLVNKKLKEVGYAFRVSRYDFLH